MTLHRASRYTLALALLALSALPVVASAQAFGLNEIGSCALARGFANTAIPCDDASSIYWNPAKLPNQRGLSFYGGVAVIARGRPRVGAEAVDHRLLVAVARGRRGAAPRA